MDVEAKRDSRLLHAIHGSSVDRRIANDALGHLARL